MIKNKDTITLHKDIDREYFNLIQRMSVEKYAIYKFNEELIKDIKVKKGRPTRIITIERSYLLAEDDYEPCG